MRIVFAVLDFVDAVNDWIGKITAYAVLLMFVVVLSEVFRRYVLNAPTVWGTELTQLTFAVYVMLSGGHIMRWGGHVNVDLLYTNFSTKTKAIVDIFTSVLFFLFVGMLIVYGGSMAWDSVSRFEHSISAWGPPLWPFKLTIPVGASLLFLQGISKLIRDIHTVVTGIPHDITIQERSEKETV